MKIMVCFDNSPESITALREAAQLAKAFQGDVLVVTSVAGDQQYYPKLIEPYEENLKEAQDYMEKMGISCQIKIAYRDVDSNVGEGLAEFAKEENVDKIVVGIRNRSKLGKLFLGSKAQTLLLMAHCPVVGVKKDNSEAVAPS
ncbi:universal stress protein [Desulfosarcina ovata subsp. sediminis]|uniref:Universal stress protein n=1 Tax=Desulfosarcina ovata subsp. sediminis TaxID=885957 RepID=A0A5K7ZPS8_9BACT|nr:universal stress protein [Desulfosarcina ovata]BBO81090.1 universal stress protein [Desulfosarcina ovata subsp. sediminis]